MSDQGANWRIGENVPWVAAWSAEQLYRLQPSRGFAGRVEVIQAEHPGQGEPLPSTLHLGRQRRGLAEHLCHLCGQVTPRNDRWLFPVARGRWLTLADGEVRYADAVPPAHRACAERAARMSPLANLAYAQPMAFPRDAGRLMPQTDVPVDIATLSDRFPGARAAMEAADGRLIFSHLRLHTGAFSRAVQRLRLQAEAA